MTAIAVAAVVLGFLPILVGVAFLFMDDPGAFLFALLTVAVVGGGLAAASWGISYLAGAS